MYADDIILYVSHTNNLEADRLLQEDLHRVGAWCLQNYMTINTTKSMCMYFGSGAKLADIGQPHMTLNGVLLPTCLTYTYLGVELDGKLSLTPHMNKSKKCFGNKLYKLNNLRKSTSKKICLEVYTVMTIPSIEYCSFYTGSAHQAELAKLQRMQNQALRICLRTGIRTVSVVDLHKECKVEFLARKRKLQLLNIMWKKARAGEALEQRHVRTRGDLKIKFAKRRAKTSFYQKSPYYRAVSLWDTLEYPVQHLPTKRRFKHAIEKLPLAD